jgi:hypothetical protein
LQNKYDNIFLFGLDLKEKNFIFKSENLKEKIISLNLNEKLINEESIKNRNFDFAKKEFEEYFKINKFNSNIYNLNKDSALECFPKIDFEEIEKIICI